MPSRLHRHSHGQIIIRDKASLYALKLERREHRARVVAWVATFALGAIFWAVVIGAVLG